MMALVKSENGSSIIWALILLVVVGILTATLLAASTHNIRFGVSEVDKSRAFYAAEAGVEHKLSGYFDDNYDYDERIILKENESESSNLEYEITKQNENDNIFESTGYVNDNIQTIEFELNQSRSLKGNAVLLEKLSNEKFYEASEPHTSSEENEPGEGDDAGDKWAEISDIEDKIKDGIIDPEDITIWEPDMEYKAGDVVVNIYDYVDFRGEEKEDGFNKDRVSLFTLLDENEDLEDWEYFKNKYIDSDDLEDFEHKGIENINQDINKENLIFSPHAEVGDDENYDIWEEGIEYLEGDIVYNNGGFYEALQDHLSDDENEPEVEDHPGGGGGGPGGNDYWDYLDDDQKLTAIDIVDSIIIVEGDLTLRGEVNLERSLILVQNNVDFGGNTNLYDSLIVSFNESFAEKPLTTTGNPSIGLEPLREETYSDWPGIEGLLPEEKLETELFLGYWRHK